jgi:hypothetical protein
MINELVEAYDDSFSVGLNEVKRHKGQLHIAEKMRDFLASSKRIKQREELFADNAVLQQTEIKKKVQEYYSIRCVPQILGPIKETLDVAKQVIEKLQGIPEVIFMGVKFNLTSQIATSDWLNIIVRGAWMDTSQIGYILLIGGIAFAFLSFAKGKRCSTLSSERLHLHNP